MCSDFVATQAYGDPTDNTSRPNTQDKNPDDENSPIFTDDLSTQTYCSDASSAHASTEQTTHKSNAQAPGTKQLFDDDNTDSESYRVDVPQYVTLILTAYHNSLVIQYLVDVSTTWKTLVVYFAMYRHVL